VAACQSIVSSIPSWLWETVSTSIETKCHGLQDREVSILYLTENRVVYHVSKRRTLMSVSIEIVCEHVQSCRHSARSRTLLVRTCAIIYCAGKRERERKRERETVVLYVGEHVRSACEMLVVMNVLSSDHEPLVC
jgi:hypothetical protein